MTSALRGEGVPSKADIVSNLSKGGSWMAKLLFKWNLVTVPVTFI